MLVLSNVCYYKYPNLTKYIHGYHLENSSRINLGTNKIPRSWLQTITLRDWNRVY